MPAAAEASWWAAASWASLPCVDRLYGIYHRQEIDRGLTVHCSTVVSHDLGNSTSVFTGVIIKTVIVLSFFVKVLRFMKETLTIKAVKT